MAKTAIQWSEMVWNPIRGCSRVSAGCMNCYAERQAARMSTLGGAYEGLIDPATFSRGPRWNGEVRFAESTLTMPLTVRQPSRIFVNSMSDLFHEKVLDEWIDRIFTVMAQCPQHTFQILTKRPELMLKYMRVTTDFIERSQPWTLTRGDAITMTRSRPGEHGLTLLTGEDGRMIWPLPNCWLGVSVEDQATADARIPLLLQTPAAVRWVSYEPALGPVDFQAFVDPAAVPCGEDGETILDWLVVGGESGPGARPFDLAWARATIAQCKAAGVPIFVKQLGAKPIVSDATCSLERAIREGGYTLRDRKGGDMTEWPEDLRIRKYPC